MGPNPQKVSVTYGKRDLADNEKNMILRWGIRITQEGAER